MPKKTTITEELAVLKEFKTAATLKIKPAGVATYMARLAIANWLREEADKLISEHNRSEVYPGGREAAYKYAGPEVRGGEAHSIEM